MEDVRHSLVVFDLETGGLDLRHPIIQLAAIALDRCGTEMECFQRKLQFKEADCDREALALNHYDREIWLREAISPLQLIAEFSDFLKRHSSVECISKRGNPYLVAQMCGYNADSFDMPRLRSLYSEYQAFLPAYPRALCVLQRVSWFAQEHPDFELANHKLQTVAEALGIVQVSHDALRDVRMTVSILRAIQACQYEWKLTALHATARKELESAAMRIFSKTAKGN